MAYSMQDAANILAKALTKNNTTGQKITMEVVEAIVGNGLYRVRGVEVPASGTTQWVEVGSRVPVVWDGGRPVLILNHNAKRAQFYSKKKPPGGGIIEKLAVDGTGEVWFLNWSVATPVGVKAQLPEGATITGIRWGADRTSFVVQTQVGTDANTRKWHVFYFEDKDRDTALASSRDPGDAKLLRSHDPIGQESEGGFQIVKLKADRLRTWVGPESRWFLGASSNTTWHGYLTAPFHDGGFLTIETSDEWGSQEADNTCVAEQHDKLENVIKLRGALGGGVAGATTALADYCLDKDRNLIFAIIIYFTNNVIGSGERTRTGTFPKITYLGPFATCELPSQPASGVTELNEDYPLGATAGFLSDTLAESHVVVVNVTTKTVLFTTMRTDPELKDNTNQPMLDSLLDRLHTVATQSGSWDSPFPGFWDQDGGYHPDPNVPHAGTDPITTNDYCQTMPFLFAYPEEQKAYAAVVALADEWATYLSGLSSGSWGISASWGTEDYDRVWPANVANSGLNGNDIGTHVKIGDLINHDLPWVSHPLEQPASQKLTTEYGFGRGDGTSGFTLANGFAPGVGVYAQGTDYKAVVCKYTYNTLYPQVIPSYRVTNAKVLTLGTGGYLWLNLERVYCTTSPPTGDGLVKQKAVWVVSLSGGTVSTPSGWQTVPTYYGLTPPAGYVADAFFANLWDNGTNLEVLSDGPYHVLWAYSTAAERIANADTRHVVLTRVKDGYNKAVGDSLKKITDYKYANLGIDFLYATDQPTTDKGDVSKHFIAAWEPKSGDPVLVMDAKYPPVDTEMDPVAALEDMPAKAGGDTIKHYHGLADHTLLASVNRDFDEEAAPYPVT